MVFCNKEIKRLQRDSEYVTILILIDGFLQCGNEATINEFINSHNPYFNRWFSAIRVRHLRTKRELLSQSLF